MTGGARTLRTACPSCGGTVPRSESSRAERCPFCEHRSLLLPGTEPAAELRCVLPPALDAAEAADRARLELVRTCVLSKRQALAARFEEPTLYFVPYLWFSATRPWTVARGTPPRPNARGGQASSVDTKVVIDDFEAFQPAVELPGFGLEGLDPTALLSSADAPLPEPFDGAELRRQGLVLSPQATFSELQGWGGFGALPRTSGITSSELVAERRRVLFVGVWAIPYVVASQRYEARLDAHAGALLAARGPEDERFRLPIALTIIAVPALITGKLMRMAMIQGLGDAVVLFLLLFLLALAGLGAFSWSLLRYEAEHVYTRGHLWSEQLGRPRETIVDRLAAGLGTLVESLFAGGRR